MSRRRSWIAAPLRGACEVAPRTSARGVDRRPLAIAGATALLVAALAMSAANAEAQPRVAPRGDRAAAAPDTAPPASAPTASSPTASTPPASAPGPLAPPATGVLAGRVLLPGGRPAAGVAVAVEDAAGMLRRAASDDDGRFRVALAPGRYTVTAVGPAAEQAEATIDVAAGRTAEATLRLVGGTVSSEVIVVEGVSEADRRRQSADAVTVVETEDARRQTADLGEVLARTQGVGVRRGGGLGSSARLSLGGLTDDQLRFFLDGVPLELAGYPFGISNVPVNLVERIEVYSGVVPVRFGADALGGGVNLVTDQDMAGTHGAASYEVGSFATNRVTVAGRHLHAPSGLFARIGGFFDDADNDYPVDVEVPDQAGRLSPARVRRFHDGYRALGGSAEVGVVDRPWARQLVLRTFASGFDKEYQHNQAMSRVYGDVTYGESSAGASLRYEQPLGRGLSLDAIGGHAFTRGRFRDVSRCVYDWFGECFMEGDPGEIDALPHDQLSRDHAAFARVNLGWAIHPLHSLRLSVAPTFATRSGDERRESAPDTRDPLSAERDLLTVVTGVEHEADLFADRLENIVFVKHYVQRLDSEEPRPGDTFRRQDRTTWRFGVGNGLRYRLADWLVGKASYEWATRLPRPDEVFGDNAFVAPNLELEPESSHNLNLGLAVDAPSTPAGQVRASTTGFVRQADQLIVLLGNERDQSNQNVYGARSVGVEAAAEWTSPGEYLALDGTVTYQDFRNDSSAGAFGSFDGDRIPNRPYLFAHGAARIQLRDIVWQEDEIAATWSSRYVHDYYRGWESVGREDSKDVIPSQLIHAAGVGYLVRGERGSLSTTFEVQNLTDRAAYDFFGVQRPGRAFYVKTTVEF